MEDARQFICPFCEMYELHPYGRASARCSRCGLVSVVILDTLRQIGSLPEGIGVHACECGHPEMRRFPDGVYWCPACGSEGLPISPQ